MNTAAPIKKYDLVCTNWNISRRSGRSSLGTAKGRLFSGVVKQEARLTIRSGLGLKLARAKDRDMDRASARVTFGCG